MEAHEDNGLLSNIHDLDKLVLADDSEKTFQALSKHSSNIVGESVYSQVEGILGVGTKVTFNMSSTLYRTVLQYRDKLL